MGVFTRLETKRYTKYSGFEVLTKFQGKEIYLKYSDPENKNIEKPAFRIYSSNVQDLKLGLCKGDYAYAKNISTRKTYIVCIKDVFLMGFYATFATQWLTGSQQIPQGDSGWLLETPDVMRKSKGLDPFLTDKGQRAYDDFSEYMEGYSGDVITYVVNYVSKR